jgi:hypothetical protein
MITTRPRLGLLSRVRISPGWERSAELAAALFGFASQTEHRKDRVCGRLSALVHGRPVMRNPARPPRLLPFRSVEQNRSADAREAPVGAAGVFRIKTK